MFKRLQSIAQIVGFVTIGLLAFSGGLSLLNGSNPVMAALGIAAPNQPQAPTESVPVYMNYQGVLRDAENQLVANGAYTLTIRIYANVSDTVGSEIWSETHVGLNVIDGRFNALLGDFNPLNSALFTDPNRYIGVSMNGGAEMLPRQRFTSAPYAFYATHVRGLSVSDGAPADAVTVDDNGNVNVQGVNVTGEVSAGSLSSSGAITGTRLTGSRLNVVTTGEFGSGQIDAEGAVAGDVLYSRGNIAWDGHLVNMTVIGSYVAESLHNGWIYTEMTAVANSVCFLTEVDTADNIHGDSCNISQSSGSWRLGAYTAEMPTISDRIRCQAWCLQW